MHGIRDLQKEGGDPAIEVCIPRYASSQIITQGVCGSRRGRGRTDALCDGGWCVGFYISSGFIGVHGRPAQSGGIAADSGTTKAVSSATCRKTSTQWLVEGSPWQIYEFLYLLGHEVRGFAYLYILVSISAYFCTESLRKFCTGLKACVKSPMSPLLNYFLVLKRMVLLGDSGYFGENGGKV